MRGKPSPAGLAPGESFAATAIFRRWPGWRMRSPETSLTRDNACESPGHVAKLVVMSPSGWVDEGVGLQARQPARRRRAL
jgi:hypothetical protein